MKNISKVTKIAVFTFIATALISCSNDDTFAIQPVDNSIAGLVQRDPNLSTLAQALTRAGLVNTLSGTGPFTIFAPTNAAFSQYLGTSDINSVSVATLKELLLNHVISGSYQSSALTTGYIKTLGKGSASATNTLSMFVNTASGVKLNGIATVTSANIIASNGVVHVVDKVIDLPTIVTHAAANPSFSNLLAVVTSTSGTYGDQSAVATALTTNTTPLTVFAPINTAFDTAFATGGWANGAGASTITSVLQYHVVSGNTESSAITTTAQNLNTLLTNKSISVQLNPTAKITDFGMQVTDIIAVDVQAANGIIHGVNKVLKPI